MMFNSTAIPSIVSVIRTKLPAEELSDAEIGLCLNICCLAVAVVLHIASKAFSGSKDQLGFDRRAFHNTATENKRLQIDLVKKDTEIQRLSKQADQLEERAIILEEESRESKEKLDKLEEEIDRDLEKYDNLKEECETAINNLATAETAIEATKQELEKAGQAQQLTLRKLEQSEDEVSKLQIKLEDEKTKKQQLTIQLEHANQALKLKETERRELEVQLFGMSVLLGEMNKEDKDKAHGWSNFEDEIEVKVPPTAEIRELAKLRTELTKLEKEHEKTLISLERLQDEKQRLQHQVLEQKNELQYRTKEVEARDADRRGADAQVSQLLGLIQESNATIKDKETTCEKLSGRIEQLQQDMGFLKEEMRAKETKVKDLDGEVKKWRNDYYKLESMSFSKESEYRRQIHCLQSFSQNNMPPPVSFDLPVNSSLDTSLPIRAEHRGSMWDLPDSSNKVISSPEDEQMSRVMSVVKSKSGRSRRSDRVMSIEKNNVERKRSHSQGRQRNENFMMPFHPLNRM